MFSILLIKSSGRKISSLPTYIYYNTIIKVYCFIVYIFGGQQYSSFILLLYQSIYYLLYLPEGSINIKKYINKIIQTKN